MRKLVTILGAGESGTGAALLALQKGFDVFVSDQGTIKSSYREKLSASGISFEEGSHTIEKILASALIVKSPGIPDKATVVQQARAAGIEVIDEIEFAFRHLTGKVIAITGTNGKTTTTLLTYHLLKSAGFQVALAGNVGESLAWKVATGSYEWYVVEISSFQLDGTRYFKPFIGILTNITPDHLDRYDYKMEHYINSKFQLVANMDDEDHFIFSAQDPIVNKEVRTRSIPSVIHPISLVEGSTSIYSRGQVMHVNLNGKIFEIPQSETALKGPHNLLNTLCAVTAAVLAGVDEQAIRNGLKTFVNAPHRLEAVGMIQGVEFVNDSKATNVDSVIYALGSYNQPLIWIAGGIDKGNDYALIKESVAGKVKALICLGKDNSRLIEFFSPIVPRILETQDVRDLVRMALDQAAAGDVVLLSPACASFDLFRNYEDRGDQFRAAVKELKKEKEAIV